MIESNFAWRARLHVQFGLDSTAKLLPMLSQIIRPWRIAAWSALQYRLVHYTCTRLLNNSQVALLSRLLAHDRICHDCKTGPGLVLNRNKTT